MRYSGSPLSHIIFLGIISIYICFYQLGSLALTDPDETFYAQTAKEMLARKDLATPYIHGEPQFEKPALFYWLVAASFKAFGVNEFAARFPSAASGVICVIFVYLLGSVLFSRAIGMLSGLILVTNVEYIMVARGCVTDMLLSALILLGFLLFFYGERRGRAIFYVLSSAAFGAAVMTKGPIGILLPGLIIFMYLAVIKDFRLLREPAMLAAAVLAFVAVALPWYLAMYRIHGKVFLDAFFGFQNVTRFLQPEHEIGSQFYFYLPVIMGGFFPWSAFLPFSLAYVFERARGRRKHSIFVLIWAAAIILFFSASRTKLVTYIFPAFPAMALMTALAWGEFLKTSSPANIKRWMKASYYLLVVSIAAGVAGFYILIRQKYPAILFDAAVSGTFLVFGFLTSLAAFLTRRYRLTFFLIVYTVVVFLLPMDRLVIPEIERFEASKDIAVRLAGMVRPGDKVGAEKDYRSGVVFYTGLPVSDITMHHKLTSFLDSKDRVWCVMKEKNHIQLYEMERDVSYTRPSYMVYKYGKKCIVTNRLPEDGRYLVRRGGGSVTPHLLCEAWGQEEGAG